MEGQRERGNLESVVSSCDQPSGTGEDCVCVCVCFRVLLVYVVIRVCVYCCI